jgi:hypothetical protein
VAFSKNKKIQSVKFCASPALPGTAGLLTIGFMLLEKKRFNGQKNLSGQQNQRKKG